MTTTSKTSARVMATDEKTGKRYVKTQIIEGAAVTVTRFTWKPDMSGWASALYDVTSPAGEVFAGAVKWDGKGFTVGSRPAASLSKAVRAVLGTEQPAASTRTRKSAATRKAEKAAPNSEGPAVSGGSVIEADPDTGLPRIKPDVAAKADAVVAAQLARNAEAGK